MLIVLLKQTRINRLLFDLAIDGVSPALLHHHARNARIIVPNGEVRNGCVGRERKQVFAFERLRGVVVVDLQDAHGRVLIIYEHIHVHDLQRENVLIWFIF